MKNKPLPKVENDAGRKDVILVSTMEDLNAMRESVTGSKMIKNLNPSENYEVVFELAPMGSDKNSRNSFVHYKHLPAEEIRFYAEFFSIENEIRNIYAVEPEQKRRSA